MDYEAHYNLLIERAKTREPLSGYTEKHHVLPKCMGGTDEPNNLVELTAEEHYVAHQLLVKIHPDHKGLLWAAIQMTGHSTSDGRTANKMYGWLKRKQSKVAKRRVGKKNGSYGRYWYYDPNTLENGKFLPEDVPNGWVKGRVPPSPNEGRVPPSPKIKKRVCTICGKVEQLKNFKSPICLSCSTIKSRGITIQQYDLDMNFIAEYNSIKNAQKVTGIDRGNISAAIKRIRVKTAGGYYWRK